MSYACFFVIIYLIYRKHRDMVGSGLYLGLCLTLVFVARFLIEYTKDIQEGFRGQPAARHGTVAVDTVYHHRPSVHPPRKEV